MLKRVSAKKATQLGMPIGTASYRLKKLILFSLLHELGRNVCYRCQEAIEVVDQLAIDHKEPWLDVDSSLFWDLENVAFSHALCNALSRRSIAGKTFGPAKHRKIGPPGTAWCTGHKSFRDIDSFHRNKRNWAGVQSYCKQCQNQVQNSDRIRKRLLAQNGCP